MSQGGSQVTKDSPSDHKEIKVFNVKRNTKDLETLNKSLHRGDVYDTELIERVFPRRTKKCVVHKELVVQDGRVDCELDLMDGGLDDVDEEEYPLYHVGCIVVALMPHGKNLQGKVAVEVIDTRLKVGSGRISKSIMDMSKPLSACADFPGYFISTSDLLNGYTLHLSITTTDLQFVDGVHPFSVQLMNIGRFCGDDMKTRYAVGEASKVLHQNILNSQGDGEMIPRGVQVQKVPDTLVMPEVYETIKRLGLKTNGTLRQEGGDKGDHRGTGAGESHAN
nr:movement protein [Grapevine virus A]WIM49280.1 MAG: movement protein [Grapevine virus A]WIM49285.1 MAG: movement protein [Grapevine virus A]